MNNFSEQNEGNDYPVTPSNRRRNFDNRPQKSRIWIPITIILGIIAVCFIGLFVMVGSFISVFGNFNFGSSYVPTEITDKTILKLDFGGIGEISKDEPFAFFSDDAPNLAFYELIEGIKTAAKDPRILGMYYDGKATISGAMATELKSAILEFKQAGKFMYSYLEASDKNMYSIALLSDSIFIPDAGMFEISGFGMGVLFLKGLYDKFGVQFEVVQCEEFKTAAEPYKNYKFSDSARTAYLPLLTQRENDFIDAVSSFRNIEPSKVISLMKEGILDSDEMLEVGLADAIKTKRQVIAMLKEKTESVDEDTKNIEEKTKSIDEDTKNVINKATESNIKIPNLFAKMKGLFVNTSEECCECCDNSSSSIGPEDFEKKSIISIADYIHSEVSINSNDDNSTGESIAIIYGEGPIVDNVVDNMFGTNDQQIVASDFVKLIEKAANDDEIKGIILRINSPGGSVIASEEIYQAVLSTREKKPVYCSMSDVAASGGYYIAMACDKIICHPNTMTGSIGVVAAIPNFSGTLKKLNINVDTISTGVGNSFPFTTMLPFTQKDKNKLYKMINNVYRSFVSKAAKSRNMSYDEMRAVAKGRVWTGIDAKARNLVDTLGNLDLAIAMMKEHLDNDDLGINIYPKRENSFDRFMKLFSNKKSVNIEDLNLGFVFPVALKEQISYLNTLIKISEKEKVLCALPYLASVE